MGKNASAKKELLRGKINVGQVLKRRIVKCFNIKCSAVWIKNKDIAKRIQY